MMIMLQFPHRRSALPRALVLDAIVCRSAIDGDAANSKAEAFGAEVLSWLRDVGLIEEAEPSEFELLECKLGGLSDRQRIDASWRASEMP